VTVTVAEPFAEIRLGAILWGALYTPPLEISPVVWLPPAKPFTCQVTALLDAPETVAVKVWVVNVWRVCVAGETAIPEG